MSPLWKVYYPQITRMNANFMPDIHTNKSMMFSRIFRKLVFGLDSLMQKMNFLATAKVSKQSVMNWMLALLILKILLLNPALSICGVS